MFKVDRNSHVLSVCRFTGMSKVLIDFCDLAGIPAATEKMLYAFGIQEYYEDFISAGGKVIQVACAGKAPIINTYEPDMDIAWPNSIPFQLFTSIDDAYNWLGVSPG